MEHFHLEDLCCWENKQNYGTNHNRLSHNLESNSDAMCCSLVHHVASSGKFAFTLLATWYASLNKSPIALQAPQTKEEAAPICESLTRSCCWFTERSITLVSHDVFIFHHILPSFLELKRDQPHLGVRCGRSHFFGGIGHRRQRAKSHLQIVWTCLTKLPGFVFSSPPHNCETLLFTVAWDQLHLLKALGLKLNCDFVCIGWRVGLANYRLVMLALTSWPLSTIFQVLWGSHVGLWCCVQRN